MNLSVLKLLESSLVVALFGRYIKTQVTGHKCRFECYGKYTTLKVSSPIPNPKSKTVIVIIVI